MEPGMYLIHDSSLQPEDISELSALGSVSFVPWAERDAPPAAARVLMYLGDEMLREIAVSAYFVFLEISALSSYTLIALGTDRRALTASYQYLIMGTIGATFIIIGVGLMYMMTGTLNMYDLSQRLPEVHNSRTVLSAIGFFIVGVCLKLALFPLHLWLPNAYAFAPSIATAFLAANRGCP